MNPRQEKPTIAIFGLGYVGLTLAAVLAEEGFTIFGIEPRGRGIAELKKGKPYIYEAGLAEIIHKHFGKRFHFHEKQHAVRADVYVVAVGTPVDGEGKEPDLSFVRTVAHSLGRMVKSGDLVILRSTVPVGTTRKVVVPIVEQVSGLKAGKDFSVAFAPERTVEGNALSELRTLPQIIGGIDAQSIDKARKIFESFVPKIIPVSSLEAAELVKLFNNTYRDVIFGFANEVALICDGFNIDPKEIISAANDDYPRSRIPLPSPGVGGYCLTKDPFILLHSTKDIPAHPYLVFHARKVNEMMPKHVASKMIRFLKEVAKKQPRDAKVALLGLAFKGHPETTDMRFSPSLEVISYLQKEGVEVWGHDPKVEAEKVEPLGIRHVEELEEVFKGVDGVIIMTNHLRYRQSGLVHFVEHMARPSLFLDPWQLHAPEAVLSYGISYSNLGFDSFLSNSALF